MRAQPPINPQYVTDEDGRRTAVILPIDTFLDLMEDLEDLRVAAERRDEAAVPHEDVVADLRRSGLV